MKAISHFAIVCSAVLLGGLFFASPLLRAESSPSDSLAEEQARLEKKRLELDKRSLELERRALELEKTRQQLQEQQSGRSLSMNLSGDVLFDYDKAALKPAAEEALKKVGVVLSQFPDSMVIIEGYTDAKGGESFNLQLSRERAEAVKTWLVTNGGVPASSITTKGYGEENPVAPNKNEDGSDNPAGRALNRRVSIIVEKPKSAPEVPAATP
ncbi:hypothetical protein BH20VER3_BH20VER3_07750 [soil metagenome]